MLKTATQFNSSENQTVNGIVCDVLTITPSSQAAVDFVVSQEQPFGPQINVDFSGGTPVVRPDAFKSGSIHLWIEQDNYLPVKVEINVDFQGTAGGGPGSEGTAGMQLSLMNGTEQRLEKLNRAVDRIRDKYGFTAIQTGRTMQLCIYMWSPGC